MRGKIDLDYDVSPDPSERHRALYLYWPTVEMTGDYTCKISTIQNEVSQTKKLTVYGKTLKTLKRYMVTQKVRRVSFCIYSL